jgi:hypothetical protein
VADGSDALPVIRYNVINANTYGVSALHGGNPDLGTSQNDRGNNYLYNNTTYCIWNRTSSSPPEIQAEYNWFGAPACEGGAFCTMGSVNAGNPLCEEPFGASVAMGPLPTEPGGFRLLGVAPNPATAGSRIHFALDRGDARIRVQAFDVTGRLVRDFGEFDVAAGEHHIPWDGRGDSGQRVRNGIYFIRVTGPRDTGGVSKLLVVQ